MLDAFESNLIEHELAREGENVVLGVSGGPDSMAMLDLFLRIREKWSLGLFVVHINHGFRGELAQRDALSVEAFCKENEIAFYRYDFDVMRIAKENGMSFEEAGRKVRYEAFEEVRNKVHAKRIAVAQNKNDQAETILMRMMRGTGIEGLKGIPRTRGPFIIRPVLYMSRSEIENYCEDRKLPICHDHTNDETIYTRNKIRHELLPYIEENFNGQIVEGLYRLGNLLGTDAQFIESTLDEKLKSYKLDLKDVSEIPVAFITELHEALRSRLIRRILVLHGDGLKDVSGIHLDEIISLVLQNRHGARKIISGIEFSIKYDTLYYQKSKKKMTRADIDIKCLSCRAVQSECFDESCVQPDEVAVDLDKLHGEISARFRKDGDKFQPLGMMGTKKLKKFFIDKKIPVEQRDMVPLVCDESGIVWVVGYRLSERVRVTSCTRRVGIIKWSDSC